MNSVKRRCAHYFESLLERESSLDIIHETLEVAECSVSLIAMIYLLVDAELLESKDTTDTKENLLLETVFPVTTIESVSDRAVILRVHVVVSIEEVESHTTHICLPYECVYHIIHIRHVNHYLITVLIESTCDRK